MEKNVVIVNGVKIKEGCKKLKLSKEPEFKGLNINAVIEKRLVKTNKN